MPKTLTVKRTTIQEFNITTTDLDMTEVEGASEGEIKSDTIEITNIV